MTLFKFVYYITRIYHVSVSFAINISWMEEPLSNYSIGYYYSSLLIDCMADNTYEWMCVCVCVYGKHSHFFCWLTRIQIKTTTATASIQDQIQSLSKSCDKLEIIHNLKKKPRYNNNVNTRTKIMAKKTLTQLQNQINFWSVPTTKQQQPQQQQ